MHAGESIPFATVREEGVDAETVLPYFVVRFPTFVSAPKAHRNSRHLVNCTFHTRVDLEGQIYTLKDFGYVLNRMRTFDNGVALAPLLDRSRLKCERLGVGLGLPFSYKPTPAQKERRPLEKAQKTLRGLP